MMNAHRQTLSASQLLIRQRRREATKTAKKSNQRDKTKEPEPTNIHKKRFSKRSEREENPTKPKVFKDQKIVDLQLRNSVLEEKLSKLQRKYKLLKSEVVYLQQQSPGKSQKVQKYAHSISLRLDEAPKLNRIVTDRVKSFEDFIESLKKPEKTHDCLLKCLQIISDFIPSEHPVPKERFDLHNFQADRIHQLNLEIAENMHSSKQLLSSPLCRNRKLQSDRLLNLDNL